MFYQLRSRLAYRSFERATRGLEQTPPLASDPTARCEVHTMLGTRDVTMYLLAVKSLLSFVRTLSVVVHSDGTLTAANIDRVRRHIEGVTLIGHGEADDRAAAVLGSTSFLSRWRAHDAAYRRLIDVEIWRRADRVIILDSDVLTNQYPHDVVDWLHNGVRPFLLGQAPRDSGAEAKPRTGHVQASFLSKVPELSQALGIEPRFLQGGTAGFCGYFRELAPERVERALAAALDAGLPMEQWGGDQCLVIFLLSTAGADRLPEDRYLNFDPSVAAQARQAMIIHFYGTHRFHGRLYPTLASTAVRRLAT